MFWASFLDHIPFKTPRNFIIVCLRSVCILILNGRERKREGGWRRRREKRRDRKRGRNEEFMKRIG